MIKYIYANHPVCRFGGDYYTKTMNFVDFLSVLADRDNSYRLILPCREIDESELGGYVRINFTCPVIEVDSYRGHLSALFVTFLNAYKIIKLVREDSDGEDYVFAGPGPNSMMFWLSYYLPKSKMFIYFVRGDTVETVRRIYHEKWWGRIPVLISSVFRSRIFKLLSNRHAFVFTYGDELMKQYKHHGGDVLSISPLISSMMVKDRGVAHDTNADNDDFFKLLFVGRLSPEKGIIELLNAFSHLVDKNMSLSLDIIGSGPLHDDIVDFISEHGLKHCVTVKGHVPPGDLLWSCYDACDVLCLPSFTEGTPRVVVEAFARQLPVMATPVGSLRHMFPDDIFFIKDNSVDNIAEGIEWCVSHRDELSVCGVNGSRTVERFFLEYNAKVVDDAIVNRLSSVG